MLLEWLQQDGALEAENLKDLLFDLEGLFMLLDAAESWEAVEGKEGQDGPKID